MNQKVLWGLATAIVVVLAISWIWQGGTHVQAPITTPNEQTTEQKSVVFVNAQGEEVAAQFSTSAVTFTQSALGTLTLNQALSASGARYANADESIVFWNKGNEVTISQNDTLIFTGTVKTPVDPIVASTPEAPKTKLAPGTQVPGTPAQIQASTWVWTKLVNGDGTKITPNKPGVFTLVFEKDGRVTGKTDCNGFGGDYAIGSDGVITFGAFMSTLMFCEDSQESVYSQAVASATRYSMSPGGELLLHMKDTGTVYFKKQ
jgi:heat shock protein HslJ